MSAVALLLGYARWGMDRSITSQLAKQEAKGAAGRDTLRYFAYGANMASSILAKRDIRPLSACPAQLPAHLSLAFRHRSGYATIMDPSASDRATVQWHRIWDNLPLLGGRNSSNLTMLDAVDTCLVYQGPHGVLYELHRADLHKLASRETGYAVSSAAVTSYTGVKSTALLFTSQPLLLLPASVPPQRRYLELMLEGAQTHGLAPEYVQWLRGLPSARPGSLGAEYFGTPSEWLARCAVVGLAACATFYAAVH